MIILQANKFFHEKGGSERYMFALSRALAARGHEVHVFAREVVAGELPPEIGVHLIRLPKIPGLGYENPDGSPLAVTTDYFGKRRAETRPSAGPFEQSGTGPLTLKVWPRGGAE